MKEKAHILVLEEQNIRDLVLPHVLKVIGGELGVQFQIITSLGGNPKPIAVIVDMTCMRLKSDMDMMGDVYRLGIPVIVTATVSLSIREEDRLRFVSKPRFDLNKLAIALKDYLAYSRQKQLLKLN